jgi:hypothetical protein
VSHVQATIAAAGKVSALHDAMLWNYHPPEVLQFFSSARHGRHMRGISAALQLGGWPEQVRIASWDVSWAATGMG